MSEQSKGQHHKVAVSQKPNTVGKGTFIVSLALMGIVGFILGTRSDFIIAYMQGVKTSSDALDLSSVQTTYQRLIANFDGEVDKQKLIDGASRGLTAAAGDRHTVFMDSQEAEEFNKDMSGEVSGIGAEIGVRTDQPTIIRTLQDSPAAKSGIMAGDVIVGVNDESMRDSTSDVVASKIRGEAGTTVKVSVLRDKEIKEFSIVRAKVNNPSVRWEIKDNVGVIIMNRFDSEAASSTRAAAKEFKSKGVKAVVLDLRDNGGGYLDAARDVASIWLKNKVIVTEKNGETVTGTERSNGDPILEGVKTVVVVNGGSASASEIVAGALQEYGAATIIGEKTFGKGSVQQIINLADGRILKVTIAKWYTPKGKNITKEGITPDKAVIMTAADTNAGKDPQMDAAMESINQ